jgi:hypothetical protein
MKNNESGRTLLEMLLVLGILMTGVVVVVPALRAYGVESHIVGAGKIFKEEFWKARSVAMRLGVQTAIRFEHLDDGPSFSVYADGNDNGVRTTDIRAGIDRLVAGPIALSGGAPGVRIGINPNVPALPPDTGTLDAEDPIRFGTSDMLSFSPLGTATPGTFYLAGEGVQAAVRVTGGSARVRVLLNRGKRWVER